MVSSVSAVMSCTTSISSSAFSRSHFFTSCSAISTMLGWYDCMARLPNGCSRMLCALLQFGSVVSAVNRPSPAIARTRRSGPRTALSKRFSSLSSSTRSWPETITSGAPIMSSQKIGPNSFASRARFCTGAVESSDSILPTTGFVGGCGIGSSRFEVITCSFPASPVIARNEVTKRSSLYRLAMTALPKPLAPPLDQLGAYFLGLFLLRPVPTAANQLFLQVGNEPLHAVGGRRRQHRVVFGHDHQ